MTTDDHSAEKRGRLDGDRRRSPPGDCPALCGLMITFRDHSGWPFGSGSGSVTSSPATAT